MVLVSGDLYVYARMATLHSTQVRPGRRRNEALSQAIVDATLAILREEGYDGLSIETIARRAGVSRPTIYTRWRTLHDLVLEAARQARDTGPVFEGIIDVPDTGSMRGDL